MKSSSPNTGVTAETEEWSVVLNSDNPSKPRHELIDGKGEVIMRSRDFTFPNRIRDAHNATLPITSKASTAETEEWSVCLSDSGKVHFLYNGGELLLESMNEHLAERICDAHNAALLALQEENERLFDLVRYQRAELHQAGLLTDDEYFQICQDGATGDRKGSRERLESYDALQEKLADRHKLTVHYEELYRQTRDELAAVNQAAENMAREADCETKALQRKNEELEKKLRIEREVTESIKRLDQAKSPFCEHNQQYLWSPDGKGKRVICLRCTTESLQQQLNKAKAALRDVLELYSDCPLCMRSEHEERGHEKDCAIWKALAATKPKV